MSEFISVFSRFFHTLPGMAAVVDRFCDPVMRRRIGVAGVLLLIGAGWWFVSGRGSTADVADRSSIRNAVDGRLIAGNDAVVVDGMVSLLDGVRLRADELLTLRTIFAKSQLTDYRINGGRVLVPAAQQNRYLDAIQKARWQPSGTPGQLEDSLQLASNPFLTSDLRSQRLRLAAADRIGGQITRFDGIAEAQVSYETEPRGGLGGGISTRAAVTIRSLPGESLSVQRAAAILDYVLGSIAGLSPKDVVLIDLDTSRRFTGDHLRQAALELDPAALRHLAEKERLEKLVADTLQPLGEPGIRVSVSATPVPATRVVSNGVSVARNSASNAGSGLSGASIGTLSRVTAARVPTERRENPDPSVAWTRFGPAAIGTMDICALDTISHMQVGTRELPPVEIAQNGVMQNGATSGGIAEISISAGPGGDASLAANRPISIDDALGGPFDGTRTSGEGSISPMEPARTRFPTPAPQPLRRTVEEPSLVYPEKVYVVENEHMLESMNTDGDRYVFETFGADEKLNVTEVAHDAASDSTESGMRFDVSVGVPDCWFARRWKEWSASAARNRSDMVETVPEVNLSDFRRRELTLIATRLQAVLPSECDLSVTADTTDELSVATTATPHAPEWPLSHTVALLVGVTLAAGTLRHFYLQRSASSVAETGDTVHPSVLRTPATITTDSGRYRRSAIGDIPAEVEMEFADENNNESTNSAPGYAHNSAVYHARACAGYDGCDTDPDDEPLNDDFSNDATERSPIMFLIGCDPARIVRALITERPQSIALVLAYLPPEPAGTCLELMPPRIQVEVVRRLIDFDPPDIGVIDEVFHVLCRRIANDGNLSVSTGADGDDPETLVDGMTPLSHSLHESSLESEPNRRVTAILDAVPQEVALRIMENLTAYAPTLVPQLRRPGLEFAYEDLDRLSSDSLGTLLRSLDDDLLGIALLGADPGQMERWLRSFPGNRAAQLRRRLAGGETGPIRLGDVEEARRRIVAVATHWILEGRILPPRREHRITAA